MPSYSSLVMGLVLAKIRSAVEVPVVARGVPSNALGRTRTFKFQPGFEYCALEG